MIMGSDRTVIDEVVIYPINVLYPPVQAMI